MREIKFRALDITRQIMHSPSTFREIVESGLDSKRKFEEFIFLQFTGLLDKNGKEIYEGDRVACPYVDPMGRLHEKDIDKEKSGVVVFEQGLFGIKYPHHVEELKSWCKRSEGKYIGNYGCPKIYEDNTYLEIIGNIYEHPDLLSP